MGGRLSTLYNADVGLYMLANKWMVNETELRVIHYTLGPSFQTLGTGGASNQCSFLQLMLLGRQNKAGETLPGSPGRAEIQMMMFWSKSFSCYRFVLCFSVTTRSFPSEYGEHLTHFAEDSLCDQSRLLYFKKSDLAGALAYTISNNAQLKVPGYLVRFQSSCALFMVALLSPWPVHQRQASACDFVTWYYGIGMAFLAVAVPSLPFLFGITALFLGRNNFALKMVCIVMLM
ncbi:hypothetical protein Pint_20338 [Pistacia integerrima]|uniref:Uncharacterized protein n=1 Tax=Pistacia integerrima TaxID=434235 RepID=A0ACC0XBC4_9ROSI|nr:hypothetical protein Pint_20338 [Pistacia integerrima]